jgi:hypothetical protein
MEAKMVVLVKNELSGSGMVIKVQRMEEARSSGCPRVDRKKRFYRCLLARPGRVLHASITAPTRGTVTVADLLHLLSMDKKGRNFLKGFKNSGTHLNAISIDKQTNVKELMDLCPG